MRRSVYPAAVGAAIGAAFAGLIVPFAVGAREDLPDQATALGQVAGAETSATPDVPGGPGGPPLAGPSGASAPGTPEPAPPVGAATTSTPAGATTVSTAVARRATDVGVSAESIKLGFLLLDLGSVARIGVSVQGDPAGQRASFDGFVAEINSRGGIHGRKVVPVYKSFDPLSEDSMREACVYLTRDAKVFAIYAPGAFSGSPLLCITEEGRTPLVYAGNVGTPSEFVRRSGGRLFSIVQASDRMMPNWANELHQIGALRGRRIGVLTSESSDPGQSVIKGALVPALERLGYEVAHVSRLSGDISTGASQVPVEVQQMRSKRVDFVFLAATTVQTTQFVQAADNQGYRPRYSISDWGGMANDTSNQNMPPSYDGTILIAQSRVGGARVKEPEGAVQRACREVYERQTKRKFPEDRGRVDAECQGVRILEGGLQAAGPDLTRASFVAGVQRLGTFEMSNWYAGSFRPGKFDAVDWSRAVRWQGDCTCLVPMAPFRRSRY